MEHSVHTNDDTSNGQAGDVTAGRGFKGFYATAHESTHLLASTTTTDADRAEAAGVDDAADDVKKPLISAAERLKR